MKNKLKTLAELSSKPILSKVHKFKDVHKGETAYLFGDGVSLKWFDLEAFSDKPSIHVSLLGFHNDFHKIQDQAKYFILKEPWFFYPYYKAGVEYPWWRNRIQSVYRKFIRDNKDKQFFISLSNLPVLFGQNITYLFRDFYDSRLPDDFITKRINPFNGSVRTIITMAIYLGFSHVFLVGFDYTHVPARALHWYEKGKGLLMPHPGYNEDYFAIAKEHIDITTVTLDGRSDYLDSITYEELTGRKPAYRENEDLASERFLKAMDTWPDYRIF